MSNIAIIGGGASGITAAIAAASNPVNFVTIYESGERIGRKILATGNGRCNMTNKNADINHYHGKDTGFMADTINIFWVKETLDFFAKLGVVAKTEEDNKVYPYSDQASSVLDVLRSELSRKNVSVRTKFDVKDIRKKTGGFLIEAYSGENAYADKIIITTGGKAAPNLGSNGSGYELLKRFGHHITALSPSLVQIKTNTYMVKKLKGIKVNATVTLGKYSESGEVLFTEYGLSGPPIFSLSSRLDSQKRIILDIMPEYGEDEISIMLRDRISNDARLEDFFTGMLNKRVGQAVLKEVGAIPLSRTAKSLSCDEISKLAYAIKHLCFDIQGTMSWNNAQVTKGGAMTEEFDSKTMESKLVNGLYAAGEVLDIDGDCGGYNLQWAWSSGYIAGLSCGEAE